MSTTKTHITRIGTVLVPVADKDRALRFFTETLGFETRIEGEFGEGERWIEVAPPGAETTIALVDSQANEVSFATDDADAAHERASGSWSRRRRSGPTPRRRRAGDVHLPGSRRQPLPSRRARLRSARASRRVRSRRLARYA